MNALLVICGLGIFSLIAEVINFKKGLPIFILIGLAGALALVGMSLGTSTFHFSNMLLFDNFSLSLTGLIIVSSIIWFWMSRSYFSIEDEITERSAMVLFVVAGAVILTSFNNMAMLFLGIEILSISLYVLAGSARESMLSIEAGFKYFLMGSFASGFLLMGIALIYGATGLFHIDAIAQFIPSHVDTLPGYFYGGILLLLVGLAFKISAVPFHFWGPDVYEGSPTSITALMATVVKIGAFAAFFRIFAFCFSSVQDSWLLTLQVITVLTLVIPNITAVYQTNVKRMLAYSSVGHVGYLLLAFISGGGGAAGTIYFYLVTYAVASLLSFCVLIILEHNSQSLEVDSFNGLFKRSPILAVALTLALLSLAGIPPLAGFFGKYMAFALAIQNGNVGLVILAVVTSLIGVYYYFRVIIAMFFKDASDPNIDVPATFRILLLVLMLLSLVLSVIPDYVLGLIR
jgi:NADH-quinone oxidoreductase subunit N